jgi:hypothetical protein
MVSSEPPSALFVAAGVAVVGADVWGRPFVALPVGEGGAVRADEAASAGAEWVGLVLALGCAAPPVPSVAVVSVLADADGAAVDGATVEGEAVASGVVGETVCSCVPPVPWAEEGAVSWLEAPRSEVVPLLLLSMSLWVGCAVGRSSSWPG